MSQAIRFETPENIQIAYRPAGLGTRFLAWAIDTILVWIVSIIGLFGMLFLIAALGDESEAVRDAIDSFDSSLDQGEFDPQQLGFYIIGLFYLFFGLGSFFYFGLSELLMRGQTVGKRSAKIRVVKSNGFSLDSSSIFLRNLFRVADQLPPLWCVPVFSSRGQRFGDMVSGTLVVSDGEAKMPPLRAALAERTAAEARFRFDAGALSRLRPQDTEAIEVFLERYASLEASEQLAMMQSLVPPLVERLRVESPSMDTTEAPRQFLEDLLAAEYRRRSRSL